MIPEVVLCAHLNLLVQGKVNIRHLRVISFFYQSFQCLRITGNFFISALHLVLMGTSSKSIIRKIIRDRRRGLSDDQRICAAKGLLDQLLALSAFQEAQSIAMYLVNDGEIDPVQVMKWCWKNGRRAYVPIITSEKGSTLLFAELQEDTQFTENKFGIKEPVTAPEMLVEASALDLVLMPLVAFDSRGNRVGMGGGYYDTTFEFICSTSASKPVLIGIAHEIQKVEKINAESWDIPLSLVVTDCGIYQLR